MVQNIIAVAMLLAVALGGAAPSEARMKHSPFGVAWGFVYGYGPAKAETFMPELRSLGAGWTKVYLFWNQVEPERGHYDWTAVDALLAQIRSPDEALVALESASTWATRTKVPLLPPSPAKDLDDYYRFVHAVVAHCKGRVRYWQNDCEPSNPVFWAGTSDEFVAELHTFHRAVKDADPEALVVAGGYDGLFNPPGLPPIPGQERGLAFFDRVLEKGAADFDVFDMRLYASPYTIPARVAYIQKRMADLGYQKPIVCTEYNGPGFFEFAENRKYYTLATEWSQSVAGTSDGMPAQGAGAKTGVAALYERAESLAPETRMFLMDAPEALERKFQRLQCRDIVVRNVLALAAGVERTMFWDLTTDVAERDDVMTLMFGKLKLEEFVDGRARRRYETAETFRRMAETLADVERVRRLDVPGHPAIFLFEATRRGRAPVYVVWEQRDTFSGEDAPATPFEWSWTAKRARAVDAFGQPVAARVDGGHVHLEVSVTPVFVEP